MLGWFWKKPEPKGTPAPSPAEPGLRGGVESMVSLLRANPAADDESIACLLTGEGFTEQQATKLIQFVPVAFTRFLYRSRGVRFAPEYVVLGADARPVARRPVADEPAYREAWAHCEQAFGDGADDAYFIPIAARSGGYRAIQDLVREGSKLASIATGPPMMME
ncbi:hypothetical protein [Zavarzinella formosa]|uniref:hypothetical protein n=1 Tax=Zavarzinella formosa TaxID=360055 RepID=UPI0002F69DF6|nr:hypothetical protein [Zavarzinella formosa]